MPVRRSPRPVSEALCLSTDTVLGPLLSGMHVLLGLSLSLASIPLLPCACAVTVTQYYCNGEYKHHCQASKSQNIAVKDVTFNNIYGDMDPKSNTPAIYIDCSDRSGCDNVQMGGINISGNRRDIVTNNVVVKQTGDISPGLPSTLSGISGSQDNFATQMRSICPF